MENTADELTGFYLSILDQETQLLVLTRREETEDPAAPESSSEMSMEKAFPQVDEARFDQQDSLGGPSAANSLFRLPGESQRTGFHQSS